MRLTITPLLVTLLCAAVSYAVPSSGQDILNRDVSLQLINAPLRDVLRKLETTTQARFAYSRSVIRLEQPVSIRAERESLASVLTRLLTPLNIRYELTNGQIFLSKMKPGPESTGQLLPTPVPDEAKYELATIRVQGKVTSADKAEALPGVNVTLKGTSRGTATQADGTFSLEVPDERAVLVFSYIGYAPQEVVVGARTTFEIRLATAQNSLDEVVVVGYGSVKKSDLTGAVGSVTAKEFGDRVSGSPASLLQGRVAGLDITGDQIRIRGVTSFYGTDPLFVIDGIIGGNLGTVNANDIERIEVLKDASATAIYGVQGANGVILVTTKTGKAGPVRVSVNSFGGFQNPIRKLDVLNARQYVDLVKEMYTNAGKAADLSAKILSDDVLIDRTNWQDATQKTGYFQEHNVNFSGGSEKSNYFVSLVYKRNTPVQVGDAVNRTYGLRAKNNFNLTPWLRLGTNLSLIYNYNTGRQVGDGQQRLSYPPYLSPYDANNPWGTTNVDRSADLTDQYNPINGILGRGDSKDFNYQVNGFAEVEPIRGLVYRLQAGLNGNYFNTWGFNPRTIDGGVQVNPSNFSQGAGYGFYPTLENILTYTKDIGAHNFSVLGGTTLQTGESRSTGASGRDFIGERYDVLGLNAVSVILPGTQGYGKSAIFSYFGRVTYGFKDRYLLTANFRANTSANFAPSNRWGYFPSMAVAWKIHEEPFLQGRIPNLSQLKLRAGYGLVGNDNTGGPFKYSSQVHTDTYWPSGVNSDVLNKGATVYTDASSKIKWESLSSTNIGLDVGFFGDRLSFTVDYFNKNTNDILLPVPQPISLGYGGNQGGGDATVNAATINNRGFEFLGTYQNRVGQFSYSVSANLTLVKNNVTSLGAGQPFVQDVSRTDTGNPVGYLYGYIADGIYRTKAEIDQANATAKEKGKDFFQESSTSAGDVRFRDLDGDGQITTNDRTRIGNAIPTHTYGANVTLGYKGFDLNVLFQGVGGNQLYLANYGSTRGMVIVQNAETYVLNRWRSETDQGNGIVPRAIYLDPAGNNRMSTLKVEDGAYLRLKQVSLGYRLSPALLGRIGLRETSNVRFYVSSFNLLTFTRFTGFDPEVGGDNKQRGYAGGGFPSNRQVVLGLKLDF